MKINGVNTEKGLARLAGRMKSYQKILGVFCKDSRQKVGELDDCFTNRNASLYTTHVHGLKSALGNIGAEKLAKDSEALEFAGMESNWGYVDEHHAGYIAEFHVLLDNIEAALNDATTAEGSKAVDKTALTQKLNNLRQSLDNMDFGGMKRDSDILMEYEEVPEIGGKIKAILHDRLSGDIDAAIDRIDTLLKELG